MKTNKTSPPHHLSPQICVANSHPRTHSPLWHNIYQLGRVWLAHSSSKTREANLCIFPSYFLCCVCHFEWWGDIVQHPTHPKSMAISSWDSSSLEDKATVTSVFVTKCSLEACQGFRLVKDLVICDSLSQISRGTSRFPITSHAVWIVQ